MLKVVPISAAEIERFMLIGFMDDRDLLTTYHHKPGDLQSCVKATMKNVTECAALITLQYYKLECDGKPIGFTITGPNILYSFGINIRYRKKEIVLEWLEKMRALLNDDFRVVLYNVNTRAIRFFMRNGMENIYQDKEYTCLV